MANATTLARVLQLTGPADANVVSAVVELVEEQLCLRLGGAESVPDQLRYIAVNVSAARFNQLGDEGKSSMTVEGESAGWLTDLFEPYAKDIQAYLDSQAGSTGGVRIRFL